MVEVTQVDRDRLAARYRELSQPGMAEEIESGAMDDHPNLIMLARHRIAAEAKLAEAVDALVDAKAFMGGEISGEYQRKAILREIETALAKLEPEKGS
jgi:hypothetical protein